LTVPADGNLPFSTRLPVAGSFTLVASSEGQTRSIAIEVKAGTGAGAPPATAEASCTPAAGPAGTSFTCAFSGLPPGAAISLVGRVRGNPASMDTGGAVAAPDGTWKTGIISSQGMPAGPATFTVTAGGVTKTAQFQVQ